MPQILLFHHLGAMTLMTLLGLTGLIAMNADMKRPRVLPAWVNYLYTGAFLLLVFTVLSGIYLFMGTTTHKLIWHYLTGIIVIVGFAGFQWWYGASKTPYRMFTGAWLLMLLAAVAYLTGLMGRMS